MEESSASSIEVLGVGKSSLVRLMPELMAQKMRGVSRLDPSLMMRELVNACVCVREDGVRGWQTWIACDMLYAPPYVLSSSLELLMLMTRN